MRVEHFVFILAFLLIGGGLASLTAQEEGNAPTQDFTDAVKAADHVVTGRILGVVDTGAQGPITPTAKTREAHRVVVRSMIKGHSIVGRTIVVRPNTLQWDDGRTYVLFLKDRGHGRFDAIPQPVLTDTPAGITALVKKLGFGVQPSLRLHLRLLGGCCSAHHGVVKELRVTADGHFTFVELVTDASGHPVGQKDVHTGVLPVDAIGKLVKRLGAIEPVQIPDGGGILDVELFGNGGEAEAFRFTMIDQPEAPVVMRALAKQVRAAATKSVRVETKNVK